MIFATLGAFWKSSQNTHYFFRDSDNEKIKKKAAGLLFKSDLEDVIDAAGHTALVVSDRHMIRRRETGGGGVGDGDAAAHIGQHVRVVVPVAKGGDLPGGESQHLRHIPDTGMLACVPVGDLDQLPDGGGPPGPGRPALGYGSG